VNCPQSSNGCRIRMHTRCARFPARSSVLGIRPSASIRYGYRVPGAGTRDLEPGTSTCLRKTRTLGMHDANPMCAFSGGRTRSSVLGVRSSASDRLRCRIPGPGYQVSGIRAIFILHRASCILHPYLNKALLPYCRIAPLPYCLIALLPHCPTALLPYPIR